jgi:4-hydroxy-3-methylbut-2-en-1-yl diphosphate synthase IspG/GcpE
MAVHILSDDQAQQLKGGNPGAFQANALGRRGNSGLGLFMRNSRTAIQPIVNTVDQFNFAINIAVNGGSIVNTQINSLAIDSSL